MAVKSATKFVSPLVEHLNDLLLHTE